MTMHEPRILVGITTYEGKDYILDRCMNNILGQDYPKSKFDVVVVDNSKDWNYFLKLKRRGYKNLYHVERGDNSREALTKAQNKIRKLLLEGNYDYLLFVESDLLIPQGTIRRLVAHQKPVVGSVYNIARDHNFIPCIFLDDLSVDGFRATRPLGIKMVDGEKKLDPQEVVDFLKRGGIQQCHGVGFGCTLIQKQLVERFPFWYDGRFENKHSDVYFYLDLSRESIPVYVDTDVVIYHEPSDWGSVKDR